MVVAGVALDVGQAIKFILINIWSDCSAIPTTESKLSNYLPGEVTMVYCKFGVDQQHDTSVV